MLKNALIAVSVIAGLLAIGLTYLLASNINKEEINRAEREMEQMRASRDSIQTVVAYKDSLQKMMQTQVTRLQSETEQLRTQVGRMEEDRAQEQLDVRSIRKPEELQRRFAETYPEVAYSDWGITEVRNEETGLELQYLLIPFNFTETFIIDHQNSLSYQKQRDTLLVVDSLQQEMGALKDSLFALEREKAEAYKDIYAEAFANYNALNEDYIQVLKRPPKIEWGLPQWGTVAAGVGAGILLGTQIK